MITIENTAHNHTNSKKWPLLMAGYMGGDPPADNSPPMADASEWQVFVLKKDQKWSTKKMDSASRVKFAMENALRDKNTLAAVALRNVDSISCSIMTESSFSPLFILKKDAVNHKKSVGHGNH